MQQLGFLREHGPALIGSVVLHVGLGICLALGALIAVTPKITQPQAIEGYLASMPSRRVRGAAAPTPPPAAAPAPATPSPAPVTPAPQPQPQPRTQPAPPAPVAQKPAPEARPTLTETTAKQQEAAVAATRAAAREAEVRKEQEQKAQELERQRVAEKAAKDKAQKALAEQLEKEAAQKREEALAARLKAEIAEKARATALEKDARATREKELARQLATEDHRQGAENAGLLGRYVGELQARIERAWIRPPSAVHGLHCVVHVSQIPGGTVTNVKIADCNADSAVQQSITLAVYRASPLPAPPDASLFERNLTLIFAPTE